ncbi:MAG: aldehyde dehydrogenase family protein [Acidobacteria bacterium]|nr:aldehyde dehydrogenase family protein [Acidobacteriota bacterium]NIM61899.1 aldehyde dehydrogenase family protein [Acidobacteriota bacterium]NIO60393.1 aldehyde dehydrogenase family protein [Acidobacteriota bacterium]NIQ31465.1 aldehyde dehydrogenase family protein [Acidobacteriota bacterium]NIQ86709.1 aldehyde dehydrogenase family protein [Acidobacteriota bacterium]
MIRTELEENVDRDEAAVVPRESVPIRIGVPLLPFIDGEPSGGRGGKSSLIDPSTGEPFATVAHAGTDDVERAVDAAVRGLALWRGTEFEERGRHLRVLSRLILESAEEIAELIAREQGKPRIEALSQEILPALDHLKFIIRHAERYHAGLSVDPRHPYYAHKRAHYLYDAVGVIALVTPSPIPFAIPLIQVAAALAMGNSVVLKPSERTPLSALRIGELCAQAGVPAGVVNVIPATSDEALRLVAHEKVDKVFVTGGLGAGQAVMTTAGCVPRPVVLSLGGNHASIVAGDADVQRAARGIVWGALANAGQNCGSIQRVYVEERAASRFVECVLEEVDKIRVGDPQTPGVDLGPMETEERRQRVQDLVEQAVVLGARLLRGGVKIEGPGYYYPPTVLLDPPNDCPLMREEVLGPVIPIVVVESLERAIMLANDSDYALSSSGWTKSKETAERLMVGLQAGVVTINDVLYSFGEPAATWSGLKMSGIGQNHGTPGLREMSRQRFVSFDANALEAPLGAYPYDETSNRILTAGIKHLHGRGRWARMRALLRLLSIKRFRDRVPSRSLIWSGKRQIK